MTDAPAFDIGGRRVGTDAPPYLIAELSCNHNGSLERALVIMEAAKEAGADAVKLQTYTADTMTIDCDRPDFRISGGLWDGRGLYELYEEAHTPWAWHEALFAKGRELGLAVFSAPFDETAVDFLETFDPPAYKIASFEAVDLALIRKAAATGRPMILSTGIADLGEIEDAVQTARAAGAGALALLHCVSGYPTPAAEANLRTLPDLARRFGTVAGLSDHTPGTAVATAAVALGAAMIEKHLTLARADGGLDAEFSLEPDEFATLAGDCRAAWEAMGEITYARKPSEEASAVFRRSLYVVADVPAGTPLTRDNVRAIRPGFGLAPKHLDAVLGQHAARALSRGEALAWKMIEGGAPDDG